MSLKRRKPEKVDKRPESGITFIGDMDSAVYACGFAGQRTVRQVHLDEESGCVASFTSIKELNKWVRDNGLDNSDYVVCSTFEKDPLEFVLHSVKQFVQEMLEDTNAEDYIFYLTGKNNFRDEIAEILPYKGGRDPEGKPFYYQEIRDYLIKQWGAIVVNGYEADDACTMKATELTKVGKDWIIATRDKDLFQIAGKFYRY